MKYLLGSSPPQIDMMPRDSHSRDKPIIEQFGLNSCLDISFLSSTLSYRYPAFAERCKRAPGTTGRAKIYLQYSDSDGITEGTRSRQPAFIALAGPDSGQDRGIHNP